MSGRISLLGALLALQLVVIAVVLLVETGVGEAAQGPYLSFDTQAVDELEITGSDEGAGVILSRTDDGWSLPDGLPADAGKVDALLERLGDLEAPWPVATSGSARARFEVTEDAFQRHLVLRAAGDTVSDVYLGTSPGYQRVHARRADADAVYSIELSNYELATEPGEWLDKALLQPNGAVVALSRPEHWRLARSDAGWQLSGAVEGEAGAAVPEAAADGAPAATEAAEDLVRRFAELRVLGTARAPAAATEPAARFRVTDAAGDYTLTLWPQGEDEPLIIASSRRSGHFELASYVAEQLLAERSALLPASDTEADATQGTPSDSEADTTAAAADES